jgi:predicted RNA-binding protein YlxR (DUF448 family)
VIAAVSREGRPIRRCAGCREAAPAADLVRLVRGADGRLVFDLRRRLGGRGLNVHPRPACLKRLGRKGSSFSSQAPGLSEVVTALRGQLRRDEAEARIHGWSEPEGRLHGPNRVTARIDRVRAWLKAIAPDESFHIRRAAPQESLQARDRAER